MMMFKNKKMTASLQKYLYSNRLVKDEILLRLTNYGNYCFLKGHDSGGITKGNVMKRIRDMKKANRDKLFDNIFDKLDEEHALIIRERKNK
jgi:hypothetical protein